MIFLSLVTIPSILGLDKYKVSLHFATQSRTLNQCEAYQTNKKLKLYQHKTSHKSKTVLKAVTTNELMSEKLFHIFRIILVLKFNKTISVHYY